VIDETTTFEDGDEFDYFRPGITDTPCRYVLQKTSRGAWILITLNPIGVWDQWVAIASNPFAAFGGWGKFFTPC
jgi:hypothetical protein